MKAALKIPKPRSTAEELFAVQIRALKLPAPEREYQFDPSRGWKADFAWPEHRLIVEVEGLGGPGGGRHQRPKGFREDCRKYLRAVVLRWTVVRVTHEQVKSGEAIEAIETILSRRIAAAVRHGQAVEFV